MNRFLTAIRKEFRHQSKSLRFDMSRPSTPLLIYSSNSSSSSENDVVLKASDFKTSTDVVAGGTSKCTLTSQSGITVFEGELSLDRTDRASPSTRAFAAIRAEMPRHLRALQDYMGLEMRVRMADKRHVYAVNITAKSFFPDDLYQGFLKPSESSKEDEAPWIEAVLPFDRFLLTSYGYEKELQREMNTDCIYTIGFTVMSETPGPFRLEIDSIRAVPFEDVADVGDSRNVNNISLSEKDEDRAERIRLSIERRRRLVKKNKKENDE